MEYPAERHGRQAALAAAATVTAHGNPAAAQNHRRRQAWAASVRIDPQADINLWMASGRRCAGSRAA
mgnify:CR=1 FL=1